MTQDFDSQQFLDDVQQGSVETKFTPIPEGDYPAGIKAGGISIEPVDFKDGRKGARFTAQWQLDGEIAGMASPTVRQQFLLDISGFDGNGRPVLKTGTNQNIRLGKLIALSGQKETGWSYRGLEASRGMVKVSHRPDKDDPEIVYAEVKAVAPLT